MSQRIIRLGCVAHLCAALVGLSCGAGGDPVPSAIDVEAQLMTAASPGKLARCARDAAQGERDWKTFRKRYPYHVQGVALSKPSSEGCRTLVVAEPPPHVTIAGLQGVDPARLAQVTTQSHGVGVDGWTKDALVVLPPMEERETAALVSALHAYLFKTAYKAYWLSIDDAPPRPAAGAFDLRVTAAELERWLVDDKETFLPVDGGDALPLARVMQKDGAGVYFTSSQGLVVWSIPRHGDIGEQAVEARQFAMDADLVIGALAGADAVLVVGRERVAPVEILPPLRFETVALLAAAKEDELAQSYERNTVFAGRLSSGGDWAPILLSPQLVDTELGSLLDITDQLLKGWSQNGTVTYENFDYPTPGHWAFPKPLSQALGSHSTVFNWNTAGLGGAIDAGGLELFWVRGTGALMVTYQPEGSDSSKAAPFEDKAYEFFARVGDPHLARVIQYTALYQIFHHFGVSHRAPAVSEDDAPAAVLQTEAEGALRRLASASSVEIDRAVKRHAERLLSGSPPAHRDEIQAALETTIKARILEARAKLLALPGEVRAELIAKLASALARPRATAARAAEAMKRVTNDGKTPMRDVLARKWSSDEEALETIGVATFARELDKEGDALPAFVDVDGVKDRFVAASLQRRSEWIRTPAVVVSRVQAREGHITIGGHNLGAAITKYRVSAQLPTGARLADGRYAASDLATLQLGRARPGLAVARPVRARAVGLALPAEKPRGVVAVRGMRFEHADRRSPTRPIAQAERIADEVSPEAIYVRRDDGVYRVRVGRTGQEIEAWTLPDVADMVARESRRPAKSGAALRLELENFSHDEARGLVRSSELHAKGDVFGVVTKAKGKGAERARALHAEFDLSKAKIHEPQVKTRADGSSVIGIPVEIPARAAGKPSLWMKVQMVFRRFVPESVRERLVTAVTKVIERLGGRPTSAQDLGIELRRELKRILDDVGEGGLMIDLPSEAVDLKIVERQDESGPDHARKTG